MAAEYSSAERRERYLRERQLKGRQPGSADDNKSSSRSGSPAPPADNARKAARTAAAQRVKALNEKLSKLRAALAAARAKSSESKKPTDKPNAVEQKNKDEAYNKDYYKKHKEKLAAERKSSGGGSSTKTDSSPKAESRSVEELESAIRTTLSDLKAAIAKLKSL